MAAFTPILALYSLEILLLVASAAAAVSLVLGAAARPCSFSGARSSSPVCCCRWHRPRRPRRPDANGDHGARDRPGPPP